MTPQLDTKEVFLSTVVPHDPEDLITLPEIIKTRVAALMNLCTLIVAHGVCGVDDWTQAKTLKEIIDEAVAHA